MFLLLIKQPINRLKEHFLLFFSDKINSMIARTFVTIRPSGFITQICFDFLNVPSIQISFLERRNTVLSVDIYLRTGITNIT